MRSEPIFHTNAIRAKNRRRRDPERYMQTRKMFPGIIFQLSNRWKGFQGLGVRLICELEEHNKATGEMIFSLWIEFSQRLPVPRRQSSISNIPILRLFVDKVKIQCLMCSAEYFGECVTAALKNDKAMHKLRVAFDIAFEILGIAAPRVVKNAVVAEMIPVYTTMTAAPSPVFLDENLK